MHIELTDWMDGCRWWTSIHYIWRAGWGTWLSKKKKKVIFIFIFWKLKEEKSLKQKRFSCFSLVFQTYQDQKRTDKKFQTFADCAETLSSKNLVQLNIYLISPKRTWQIKPELFWPHSEDQIWVKHNRISWISNVLNYQPSKF